MEPQLSRLLGKLAAAMPLGSLLVPDAVEAAPDARSLDDLPAWVRMAVKRYLGSVDGAA